MGHSALARVKRVKVAQHHVAEEQQEHEIKHLEKKKRQKSPDLGQFYSDVVFTWL